jgi:DNA-directed RNA polymerase specialized sigma24 family protein
MTVVTLIELLRRGDPHAARLLWDTYHDRLVPFVRSRLRPFGERVLDEEDVLVAVFARLCASVQKGDFPHLTDWTELQQLLFGLAKRQVATEIRHLRAAKRGGQLNRRTWKQEHDGQLVGTGSVVFRDSLGEALAQLGDDQLREVAVLRLEGYEAQEIADRLQVGLRTIERRLQTIRNVWKERFGLIE